MSRINSLDGVRGLAVSLVVLFHFGWLPVGWIGVQIFFVLSGYLITQILLQQRDRGPGEYFGRFYWRRSLRIFPLYYIFLAGVATSYIAAGEPRSFGADWPWLASYTANFARMRDLDVGPAFVHLWSLSVEEQFYLVWPLVVYFTSPRSFRLVIAGTLVVAPLIRLGIYLEFAGQPPDWTGRSIYGFPLSQFDAFAAGAAIACWPIGNPVRWFLASIAVLAVGGLCVLAHQHLAFHSAMKWSFGYAMFLMQDGGFVWGYSLLNIAAALGIACAIRHPPKLLNAQPIVRVGVISYGVYVYHVPCLLLVENLPLAKPVLFPLYCAVVYVLAELSFRFVETPFLRLKDAHFLQGESADQSRSVRSLTADREVRVGATKAD
ncbi:acyltransferase [Bradyrhizobium sp. SRL28]|uniref:acyltransferase family protein n=1 Tax=Bradyrhizobium sp. SRL28 TaxID=2836178 RepID=UPI001BDE75E2|nr:acyltransferase [Bradyrhizobium sp. SRL28]MBT1515629.1 acyltransferase [Bradyrhizobium sp. SRL28]